MRVVMWKEKWSSSNSGFSLRLSPDRMHNNCPSLCNFAVGEQTILVRLYSCLYNDWCYCLLVSITKVLICSFSLLVSFIRFRINLNRRTLISIQTIRLILPQRAQLASKGHQILLQSRNGKEYASRTYPLSYPFRKLFIFFTSMQMMMCISEKVP